MKSGVVRVDRPDVVQHAQLLQLSPEGRGGLILLVGLNEIQRNEYPEALAVLRGHDKSGVVGSQNFSLTNILKRNSNQIAAPFADYTLQTILVEHIDELLVALPNLYELANA